MYTHLPSTRALEKLLQPAKKKSGGNRARKYLIGVLIIASIVAISAWALFMWNVTPREVTFYTVIVSSGTAICAAIALFFMDVLGNVGILKNPAGELSDQLDEESSTENEILFGFRSIPLKVLVERTTRIESQIVILDKWLDIARLMGLMGLPLFFVSKKFFEGFSGFFEGFQLIFYAGYTGIIIGALALRSGIRGLHRVSSLLRRASEQYRFQPTKRERRKRR